MTTMIYDNHVQAIVRRAYAQVEARRAERMPLLLAYISALFFLLLIAGACCSEFFSAGIGFNAAFPTKSDGTSLAGDLMSLRYPIIFCLLAGDVMLNAIPNHLKAILDRFVHGVGIGAILLLLFGVGAFMFSATFLTLGTEGQGLAGHLVGAALGIASASMFTLSFLGSHAMIGKLMGVLPLIVAGRAQRARITAGDALMRELEQREVRVKALRESVAEMEQPDALRRKAANEAGVIVGLVASEAHDLVASRRVRGERPLEPQDHSEIPDVPLDALEQRSADLQHYTSEYFFNLLKQKEA